MLLRVLTERHPELGDHVDGVVTLTAKVGLELGMAEEDRTALWQAAALHDIGKAAMPDAILNKPGPLDEDEWAFMRRHTVIGERILDAAPALRRGRPARALVARALRRHRISRQARRRRRSRSAPGSSRSATPTTRWSPTGRTDAACRASSAVAELARCAGTQFDPAVVDAFVVALTRAAYPLRPDARPGRRGRSALACVFPRWTPSRSSQAQTAASASRSRASSPRRACA